LENQLQSSAGKCTLISVWRGGDMRLYLELELDASVNPSRPTDDIGEES